MAEKKTVLAPGTRARVISVDMHGHCGRDFHPSPEDVGFEGTIVDASVEIYHGDGSCDVHPRAEKDIQVPPGAEASVCYTVVSDTDKRALDLMDHEIEPVDEDTVAARKFALQLIERHLGVCLEAMEDLTDSEHSFFSAEAGELMEALEVACLRHRQTVKNI